SPDRHPIARGHDERKRALGVPAFTAWSASDGLPGLSHCSHYRRPLDVRANAAHGLGSRRETRPRLPSKIRTRPRSRVPRDSRAVRPTAAEAPWIPLALAAAALVAYANSFGNPFLFDDLPRIAHNERIRALWSPEVLSGTSRPFVQWTFALNYAVSGLHAWSYHALNALIHALAAITLFAVVRRSLRRTSRYRNSATPLAFASALVWVVHPLHTEAVTYVVQRSEALCGLLYLLAVYGVIRGAEGTRRWAWFGVAIASSALGAF